MISHGLKEGALYKATQNMKVYNVLKGEVIFALKIRPIVYNVDNFYAHTDGITVDALINNSVRALRFRIHKDYSLRRHISNFLTPILPQEKNNVI